MLDIKIVMALSILFSQYSNLSHSKVICAVLRLYCIVTFLFATFYSIIYISYLLSYDPKGVGYNTMITIEYIIWCFVSQTTSDNYISTYTRAILCCDSFMGYAKLVIQIKYVFILTMLCIILSTISLYCDAFVSQFWTNWFAETRHHVFILLSQWFMMQSIEVPVIRVFVVVGLLQNRLMMLRQTLENHFAVSVYMTREDDIESKFRIVRKCIITYKNLLDAFDSVYGHFHRIVSTYLPTILTVNLAPTL